MIRMTVEDPVDFDASAWQEVAPGCKDLINKLLVKDPEGRICLTDVLAHEWFDAVRSKYGEGSA